MKYAIVESGGKQYKAVEGESIVVDRLPVETGMQVRLDQVLLLVDGETITVGAPVVKDTPVWTKVAEHFRGEKVTIFKYRPKKRIRVKTGHRQNYTRLLVEQIGGGAPAGEQPVEAEEKKSKPQTEEKPVKAAAPKKEAAKAAPNKAEPKGAPKSSSPKGKAAPAKKAPAKKPAAKK